jgi:hypothetical protein
MMKYFEYLKQSILCAMKSKHDLEIPETIQCNRYSRLNSWVSGCQKRSSTVCMVMNKLPAHPPVFIFTPSRSSTLICIIILIQYHHRISSIIWPIIASASLYFYQWRLTAIIQEPTRSDSLLLYEVIRECIGTWSVKDNCQFSWKLRCGENCNIHSARQ